MFKRIVKNQLAKRGYAHVGQGAGWPDMDKEFFDLYEYRKPYTLTSIERMYALYKPVKHILDNSIEGDLVECGIWKGRSVMLMASVLSHMKATDRKIYMYDTYEGMSEPTDKDINFSCTLAKDKWQRGNKEDGTSNWCYSSLDSVKNNISKVDFPTDNYIIIKGMVEDTIPANVPSKISLLRLDTDLYESTYHELKHLYPLLTRCGVLIIDDYGHWRGSREATDRFIDESGAAMFLNRIDYAGRLAIKCEPNEEIKR